MSITLKTVGIIVNSMGRTLAFYRALGFDIPAEADLEANVDFATPQGIVLGFLTLERAQQADPHFQVPTGSSINLQFECDIATEVDFIYKKLIGDGYKSYAEPWDAFWGQRFARVVDPDGRVVNFYAEL